jgi:hypothetical protein
MKPRPGTNQGDLRPRKVALDDLQVVDPHLGLSPGRASVKVRRTVVVEVHLDDDPMETADRGHATSSCGGLVFRPLAEARKAARSDDLPRAL